MSQIHDRGHTLYPTPFIPAMRTMILFQCVSFSIDMIIVKPHFITADDPTKKSFHNTPAL